MKRIALVLISLAVFAQSDTRRTIIPLQDDSATGFLGFRELYQNGNHEFQISAQPAMAATIRAFWPAALPVTNGECLQATTGGVFSFGRCGERLVSDYDWSQTPGGSLSVGANTVTLTPCPLGLSATEHYVYISGGTGTAEVALMEPDTCTAGAATGTVTITAANTHSGAWAVESSSDGWQEALFSVADSGVVRLRAGVGTYNIYSDIRMQGRYVTIQCDGPGTVLVPKSNNIKVFSSSGPAGPRIKGCQINNTDTKTGVTGIYTYNPTGDSFGAALSDIQITGVATCFDLQTVYGLTRFDYNRMINCTDTALFLSNVNTGDAGIGLVGPGNIFSDSVNAPYGINWNGPGNFKLQGNSFNGYVEQVHLEEKMGVVNVSGTSVTWVSGNKFRASMAGQTLYAGSTVATAISTYNSDTSLTLSSSAATCTGCSYYVGISGQIQIMNNTFDSWTATTHNVRFSGDVPFFNFQVQDNFTSNPNASTYAAAITVDGAGWYFGSIKGNNLQSSYVIGKAVDITAGNNIDVSQNQIVNHLTGVNIGASASVIKTDGNACANSNTTNCILSASSSVLREVTPVTYTQLAALTAANSSSLYCSDCAETGNASATCIAGGSGAVATRINGAWKCDDGSKQNAFIQSGNSFGASAELGTNDANALYFKTNNTNHWRIPTTGHLWAESNNTSDIGAGLASNSPRSVYAVTSVVTPLVGNTSAAALGLMTDSTTRWNVSSTGMLAPASDDNYDVGLTGTRVRTIYAKAGEFFKSGSTASSDYVKTRKFNIMDQTGSTGSWDLQATVTASNSTLFFRDNVGDPWLYAWRQDSGSPVNYALVYGSWLPAKRDTSLGHSVTDSTFGTLGSTTNPWSDVRSDDATFGDDVAIGDLLTVNGLATFNANVDMLATSGTNYMYGTLAPQTSGTGSIGTSSLRYGNYYGVAVDITGTMSAATLNATGSPAYRVAGTTVIDASRNATFVDLTVSGTCTGCGGSNLPVVDTTGIAKGSSDATKIVRLEVDGLTTGTTRVLTVPDANMTLAGRDVANTFTAAQTYNSTVSYASTVSSGVVPTTNVAYDFGSSSLRWATAYVGGVNTSVSSTFGGSLLFSADNSHDIGASGATRPRNVYIANALAVGGDIQVTGQVASAWTPSTDNTRTLGTASNRWSDVRAYDATFTDDVTIGDLLTVTGNAVLSGSNNTMSGNLAPGFDGLGSVGTSSLRYGAIFSYAGNFSGVLTLGSTITGDVLPTTNNAYILGSSATPLRWAGINGVLGNFSGQLTVTDVIPAANNTYISGSSSSYWNQVRGETFFVENSGRIRPTTTNTGSVGLSTARFNKAFFTDLDVSGTITPPSGTAFSGTKTVRDAAGTGTCTLTFSSGIMTGGTC